MGQRRGVPESGVSAAADAAAGASLHAELPQPGRDAVLGQEGEPVGGRAGKLSRGDRKSTRLNSSHLGISYAVFCLKKKNIPHPPVRLVHPPASPTRPRPAGLAT